MKTILEEFRQGSMRDRLAITSDVFSILGVSLAVILAPLLKAPDVVGMKNILNYIQLGAGMLFGLLLLTMIAILLQGAIRYALNDDPIIRTIVTGMIWLLWLIAACIGIGIGLNSLPT